MTLYLHGMIGAREDELQVAIALSEIRLDALERLVAVLGAILLNRLEVEDRVRVIERLLAGAQLSTLHDTEEVAASRHRNLSGQLIKLMGSLQSDAPPAGQAKAWN